MLECHYGVPMAGAVLNTINTRLDAATIAFQFDHGEAKVLITDREFSKVVKEALALAKVKPLVIDYDDPEYSGAGERLGSIEYEDFIKDGDPNFAWAMPDDEWDAIALNYTSGTTGDPKGVVYHHRGAYLLAIGNVLTGSAAQALRLSLDAADVPLQRLVLPLDDLGGGGHPCVPARGAGARRCMTLIATAQGDASLRRADRDGDAAQRAGRGEASRCRTGSSSSPRRRRRPRRCSRR